MVGYLNQLDVIQTLLDKKANNEAISHFGRTPLDMANSSGTDVASRVLGASGGTSACAALFAQLCAIDLMPHPS